MVMFNVEEYLTARTLIKINEDLTILGENGMKYKSYYIKKNRTG